MCNARFGERACTTRLDQKLSCAVCAVLLVGACGLCTIYESTELVKTQYSLKMASLFAGKQRVRKKQSSLMLMAGPGFAVSQ